MTQDPADGTRSAWQAPIAEHWLRKVEFESLPRVVQDRFVAATAEQFPPWPILRAHPHPPASRGWAAVSLVSLAALVVLAVTGFGDPSSVFVTRPLWGAVLFTAVIALVLLGLLRALAARGAHDLPFRAGVYVFPSEVVDARSPTLRIHPLAELSTIRSEGRVVHVAFRDGAEFSFHVVDHSAGESAVAQVLRARDALEMSHDAPELLGLVDPLWESSDHVALSANAPFHVRWSFWVERSVAVALAGACVLGPPLFLARDWASDEAAFRRAVKEGSSTTLAAYASHGKRHVQEVRERVLPLLVLRGLRSTAAIEQWMTEYPVAATLPEAKAARHDALLRDLDALSTIPSIRKFAAAHVADGLATEVSEAMLRAHRALLVRRVGSLANEHLLATPAACGTALGLLISQGASSFRDADQAVSASPKFGGSSSFPSVHLAAQPIAEASAQLALVRRIQDAFPEGCLTSTLAAPGMPVLELRWTPRYTGTLVESTKPPAVFADLAIDVEARLLGADGRTLAKMNRSYTASVRASSLATFAHLELRDPSDSTVERVAYEELVRHTLDQAARDVGTWFVGQEPEPALAPL